MSNDSVLKSYLELNMKLARTMTVKSTVSAESLNNYLRLTKGANAVDDGDPLSWKYYKNIAGEYHETDKPMYITSLDTTETIEFTKLNLDTHTDTWIGYSYGSRYYYALLERYPDQIQLIHGILYPVDIREAIEAEDGTVLSYDKSLVEPQEHTLIYELEEHIKRMLFRWNVTAYRITDEYFPHMVQFMVSSEIITKLLNLRLRRINTNEVHSFHIKQYLASNGKLDRFYDYLLFEQALYLYRNLPYIKRNPGKEEQFLELTDHILSKRRIPIALYRLTNLDEFNEFDYRPEAMVKRHPINQQFGQAAKTYLELPELYSKENKMLEGTLDFYSTEETKTTRAVKDMSTATEPTKDVDSTMVDITDSVIDPPLTISLRHWAYMANTGLYSAVVNIQNPKDESFINLHVKDALIYFYYIVINMAVGSSHEILPIHITKRVRHPLPSAMELYSVVGEDMQDLYYIAEDLLKKQPKLRLCPSVSSFTTLMKELYISHANQWYFYTNTHSPRERAHVENMINQIYSSDVMVVNTPYRTYDEWRRALNVEEYDYTLDQATQVLVNIVSAVTGNKEDDTKLMRNVQKAMLEIMAQLGSYSTQYIHEINDSKLIPVPMTPPGFEPLSGAVMSEHETDMSLMVAELGGEVSTFFNAELTSNGSNYDMKLNNRLTKLTMAEETLDMSGATMFLAPELTDFSETLTLREPS